VQSRLLRPRLIVLNELHGGESNEAFRAGSKGRGGGERANQVQKAYETGRAWRPVALSFPSSAALALSASSSSLLLLPLCFTLRAHDKFKAESEKVNIKGLWRLGGAAPSWGYVSGLADTNSLM
jgi:hypothetical protein